MKLASCDNCAFMKAGACEKGMMPDEGEFLCAKYAMSAAFHDEILALAKKEFEREVNQAMLKISVVRAERNQAFAG